jgi:hypothetical protein
LAGIGSGAAVLKLLGRIHEAGHDGVAVQVMEALALQLVGVQLDGMVALLSELVLLVVRIALPGPLKHS